MLRNDSSGQGGRRVSFVKPGLDKFSVVRVVVSGDDGVFHPYLGDRAFHVFGAVVGQVGRRGHFELGIGPQKIVTAKTATRGTARKDSNTTAKQHQHGTGQRKGTDQRNVKPGQERRHTSASDTMSTQKEASMALTKEQQEKKTNNTCEHTIWIHTLPGLNSKE
jgi:hypothetical protein